VFKGGWSTRRPKSVEIYIMKILCDNDEEEKINKKYKKFLFSFSFFFLLNDLNFVIYRNLKIWAKIK
jgi:hypothetical protein